ncbi:uncharacterized protein DS421_1g09630 [Arachis hypogaea]|nr:uncharacterized protein DS421_1g09630 [Arachis hypogaea]
MAHSSTSSSNKTQTFKLRATFQTEKIELVAEISRNHQQKIELSINNFKRKRRNITQEKMAARNQPGRNQTKDLKCATHLLSDKFRNMSEQKKIIVRDLGFGGLMHIPPLRVHHQVLRELANNFKLGENRLETGYGSFKITPRKIGDALGINVTGDLFPQKVDYKKLSEDDKGITDYKEKKKKAIDGCLFALMIIYFHLSKNKGKKRAERPPKPWIVNWSKEQLVERMSAETAEILKIVKMAETREKMKKIEKKGKKQEIKKQKRKASSTSSSEIETTDSDSSTSESETQEDSEDSPRKKPSKKGKIMDSKKRKKSQEDSESESSDESEESSPVEKQKKKKKTQRTPKKTQSKKKKVVVEHSSPEEDQYNDGYSTSERYEIESEDLDELLRGIDEKSAAEGQNEADLRSTEGHYVSSETIPDVNLGSDDPFSQGCTEQSSVNNPAESMLSPVQQSASEPADSNMMVVRERTPSEALAIVPIQVFVPVSQTTTVPEFEETPETDFEPTPLLQIEGTSKTTPEPPQQLQESTTTLPPAPTKIYPAAEDAAALLMMAQTTSYAPRIDQMPSFSLGLTDSSQEEASTEEGASTQEAEREKSPEAANLLEQLDNLVQKIARNAAKEESKSPQIQRETGGESSGRFETPAGINQNTDDMKQKCYIWGTRVKTYADGRTNEYENMCTLMAQDKYILTKMHIASLQAATFIEAENMAISKHPNGEFISLKTNKEFRVEDYPSFIPFIDAKKLTSHPYIFAPVCHADHWWLWVIDTRKRRFHILDPLHKKAPSNQRKQLNKFTLVVSCAFIWVYFIRGYVISRMRAYVGGKPLKKGEKEKEIKASYVKISGQKSTYDCAIYIMKWLELIEENIKKGKYEWDNWKQNEVDHYRVEYASRILFNEMSKERDEAIRASNAIRLSKPSSVLLSPFCQINSTDIENV